MSNEPAAWQKGLRRLGAWLRALPRPCGIFCDTDHAGADLLRACQHLGVRVPDDVAVIAVGDDDLLCALAHPPLSSVSLRPDDVGRLAVSMLEERLRHPRRRVPDRVMTDFKLIERASSELLAVEDRAVAAALRLVRERMGGDVSVDALASAAGLSRRMFELRFKASTGRTPHAEILRARLARAKELLTETSLTVGEIAERCGYGEPQRLCEVFARSVGKSPAAWRAARRGGGT